MYSNERPIYRQIRDMIVERILASGDGALLPSVRALAAEAGVNPLTVAKAYHDLQASGLVTAKKGVGLFASDGAAKVLLQDRAEPVPHRGMAARAGPHRTAGAERGGFVRTGLISPPAPSAPAGGNAPRHGRNARLPAK